MSCFICNLRSTPNSGHGKFISKTTTKYSGQSIASLIENILSISCSVQFEALFESLDSICSTCNALLDELDRFRQESKLLQSIIVRQVCRKYDIIDSPMILSCDKDQMDLSQDCEEAAFKSFHKNQQDAYACNQCYYVVTYFDEIPAHYKYHQFTDNINEDSSHIRIADKSEVIQGIVKKMPMKLNIISNACSDALKVGSIAVEGGDSSVKEVLKNEAVNDKVIKVEFKVEYPSECNAYDDDFDTAEYWIEESIQDDYSIAATSDLKIEICQNEFENESILEESEIVSETQQIPSVKLKIQKPQIENFFCEVRSLKFKIACFFIIIFFNIEMWSCI